MDDRADVREGARRLLHAQWDSERGHTYPNCQTYPHQWLWDSCFAAIAWGAVGEPERGVRELSNALSAQFADGFVPHMRYAFANTERGPRSDCSSFTQPPMYAHAARVLESYGPLPEGLVCRVGLALEWLWQYRRTPEGLLFLVHPWESGADDSPRWDSWVADFLGKSDYRRLRWWRPRWSRFDRHLVDVSVFNEAGTAVDSTEFVAAPAAFNALAAHAAGEYAALSGDASWGDRAGELADVMDRHMWSSAEGLWSDVAMRGGGDSVHVPTLDGVLPALVTSDGEKAARALDQLASTQRFAAPYGPTFVARSHSSYRANGYWRGSAWMQMSYLARLAALRWGRGELAAQIGEGPRRGAVRSG
ncbi:MAG TPA: hypothetical protein VGJ14_06030, partial [Sporichthyaceae bacterium]